METNQTRVRNWLKLPLFLVIGVVAGLAFSREVIRDSGLYELTKTSLEFGGRAGWLTIWGDTVVGTPSFYFLVVLGFLADRIHIPLPRNRRMSALFLILFASLLILGPAAGQLVLSSVTLVALLRTSQRSPAVAQRFAQCSIALFVANVTLTYNHVFIYGYPGPDDNPYVALAACAYLLTHVTIKDLFLSLEGKRASWRALWREDRVETIVTLAMAPMALLMAYMHNIQGLWGALVVLIPMSAIAYGVHLYVKVQKSQQELAAYNQQLAILQDVASRISSQIDLQQTLDTIGQELPRVIESHESLILLLDPQTQQLVRHSSPLGASVQRELKLSLHHGLIGKVATERCRVMIGDLSADALDVGELAGFRSLLAVPILSEHDFLGVLVLLHRDADAFNRDEERLLIILAAQAAVAIKNAQLYRATQQLAVTDGLTGVFNRRYFEEQLHAELTRGRRHDHPTGLILLDVDHFKTFNDTHGHLLGDQVLQGVAQVLKKSTRETDLVARYGGEEFAIILPETPPDAALEVAERIRRNIKNHPFWGRNDTPLTVTVSVGLACDPSSVMEPRALIDVADSGLYRCKHEGRDRVSRTICRADAPPEIQSSRQESAPEPTLRRRKRATQTLSAAEWDRYLTGHFAVAITDWLLAAQVAPWVPQAQDVLRELATRSLDALRQRLTTLADGVPNETQDLGTLTHPTLDHTFFDRFSACGINQVQLEWILITLQHRIHNLIQGAPFSLEERVAISQNQDHLTQALLLGRAEYWQARIVYQAHTEAPQS